MTLQRFLNGVGDTILSMPVIRALRPAPAQSMPVGTILGLALIGPVLGILAGLILMGLMAGGPMRGSWWPVRWLAGLGIVAGLLDAGLVALAWNRRASRLRLAGRTDPEPVPPRRWWQTLIVGPVYLAVVLGLTPLVLWFAGDNALGTRAWRRAHAELVARGEPLTMGQLLGPAPSDDENFAATPLLRPLLDYRLVVTNGVSDFVWADPLARHRLDALGFPELIPAAGAPPKRSKTPATNDGRLALDEYARGIRAMPIRQVQNAILPELATRYGVATSGVAQLDREKASAIVVTNAAADVIDYLRRFEPEMEALARGAARPRCRFPVHWDEVYAGQMAHLTAGKRLSTLFRVRAAARLAAGDGAGALADTRTLLALTGMFAEEPLLISQLVRIAQVAIGIQGVWEGLAARRWDDAQIASLQEILGRIDLRDTLVAGLQGERRTGNAMYDGMLGGRVVGASAAPGEDDGGGMWMGDMPLYPSFLAPRGFIRRNQVNHNRLLDALIDEIRNPAWPTSATNTLSAKERLKALGFDPMTPEVILPAMLLPALDKVHTKAARQNAAARLAETACALERFRLKHGRHPDRLEELVPAFLSKVPPDPMNGSPLHYRMTGDGWYRLWSVGLNGRDDDGTMKAPASNDREGDWVWPLPVPSTEPRLF